MQMSVPAEIGALQRRVDSITETYTVRVSTGPVPTGARTGREVDKAILPRTITIRVDRIEDDGTGWMTRDVEIHGVHRAADGTHTPAPVAVVFTREQLRGHEAPSWVAEFAAAVERRQSIGNGLLTRRQTVELLQSLGRPVTERSLANYEQNPPAGWPGVAERVGRTPLYCADAVEAYARASARSGRDTAPSGGNTAPSGGNTAPSGGDTAGR